MIPWDFGLINAIKKQLKCAIFPSEPPEEQKNTPYVMFEMKKFQQISALRCEVNFLLTIVDDFEYSNNRFNILKIINHIIHDKLTLIQGQMPIGSAQIKTNSVENKANTLILNLTAMLDLEAIYEDAEGDENGENLLNFEKTQEIV